MVVVVVAIAPSEQVIVGGVVPAGVVAQPVPLMETKLAVSTVGNVTTTTAPGTKSPVLVIVKVNVTCPPTPIGVVGLAAAAIDKPAAEGPNFVTKASDGPLRAV